ncbi:MAG: transposase [Bacteroidales bacterium]|nr:transposase [Bacteroidales bacterium]
MSLPKFSKSKPGSYENLINLMFVYSVGAQVPVYYRIMPGDIKDVKSFSLCFKESGIKDATAIIDKGFYSKKNIRMLEDAGMKFIVPLKRSDKSIDYAPIMAGGISGMEGHFSFEGRNIWYYRRKAENRDESYTEEAYRDKYATFGTLSIITNSGKAPKDVYVDYKSHCNVETMINTFKNVLDIDRSYMQDEHALEGWMFSNYIALHWYYKIYQLLVRTDLISKYSPMDILDFLQETRKIKIDGEWYLKETIAKTAKVLKKLGLELS